jgi:glycosyltransferase involved in cell wall biosynthesis
MTELAANSVSAPVESSDPASLPRLLYVGGVRVETTVAGMAVLYRLLQNYPPQTLRIVEGNLFPCHPEKRLPNVAYETLPLPFKRLLFSRFHSLMAAWCWTTAPSRARSLAGIARQFKPQAILTVAHSFAWMTAAELAHRLAIPLHLIAHDDFIQTFSLPRRMWPSAHARFGRIYGRAASRLCISPYMAEMYRQRYGAPGTVLYPLRALDAPEFNGPPPPQPRDVLTFAYAGSLSHEGYIRSVSDLALALQPLGHRVVIYSAQGREALARHGLDQPNVDFPGLVSFTELAQRLRKHADVLFVPMAFDEESRSNMQISFPSKLADYTAIGLPLLIQGPEYCSAVRWARENTGVAEVVDQPGREALAAAVGRLAASPGYRRQLGGSAWTTGQRDFAHGQVIRLFHEALTATV